MCGALFSLLGRSLAGGLDAGHVLVDHSLGINIDLWWGVVLLGFGAAMLWVAWRAWRRHLSSAAHREHA